MVLVQVTLDRTTRADLAACRALLDDRLAALPGVLQGHTYVVMEEVRDARPLADPGERARP